MLRDERRFRFLGIVFDPRTGEIRGEERVERLAPKPALVLRVLLEHAGRLVTRERLHDEVWPDTVIEFDKNLNYCIRQVRRALRDSPTDPTFVETLPRRGYRFRAPVEVVASGEETQGRPGPVRARRWLTAGVAAVAVAWTVMLPGREASGSHTPDPRAREMGEMGGYLLQRREGDDLARSVEYFRQAIALDPAYARAYYGLGSAYRGLHRIEEAREAFAQSLELDPGQWAPHVTLGLDALYTDYDRARARRHFGRARTLAPDQVVVRHTWAWALAVFGQLDQALDEMQAALELDPVSPRVNGDVGRLYYLAGSYDQALVQCRRTQELLPDVLRPGDCLVQALTEKGALEEARSEAATVMREHGAGEDEIRRLLAGAPAEGLDAYWRWAGGEIGALADAGRDSHVHAAAAWARAGEKDLAIAALEAAFEARCPVLPQMSLDPALRPLRDDPRFREIARRVG